MSLLRQYLRDAWWIAIGYFVILEAALIAAIIYWPKFRDNVPAIAKLVPFESLQRLLDIRSRSKATGHTSRYSSGSRDAACSDLLLQHSLPVEL